MQEVRQHKKRVPKHMDEPNIFSGLVFCADCGKPLVLHRASTMKRTEYNFKCYTYGKKGKTVCTPHHNRAVPDAIRQLHGRTEPYHRRYSTERE